ncbi:Lipid A biosynthesis palmitoleoyltransferase [Tepidimonas sediminis]|uniref:Lipid A biosynthesis palmitoleoyltransferase n=1 Tax=Tepidimonas sediminis TaxID=2588941 RepID=A0A554WQ03_9BURK|nr:lysophospholipid acyltransferase family protein [Tepidimonas sediminis]TSE25634.1 Lipid A biosynthesis palmitoleoyltransferase [Tepidimonas sediminis]
MTQRIVRALVALLAWLPLPLVQGLGWLGGWAAWLASAPYRRRWRAHTRLAGLRGRARWASVGAAGQQVAELPRLWFGPPVRVGWEGAAHIEAALAQRRGVLFLTPHLGCFEVTPRAYAERFGVPRGAPITVLYRPSRQAALAALLRQARQRPGMAAVPTTLAGVRQLMQALRRGEAVGLLPDQVPPLGQGVWAPFFGRPAYTMTLAARLAQQPGVQVLLAWGQRLPWGRGYVVHVQPWAQVMEEPLAAGPAEAAAQINRAMETLIRRCPQQYLWGYARYKAPRDPG